MNVSSRHSAALVAVPLFALLGLGLGAAGVVTSHPAQDNVQKARQTTCRNLRVDVVPTPEAPTDSTADVADPTDGAVAPGTTDAAESGDAAGPDPSRPETGPEIETATATETEETEPAPSGTGEESTPDDGGPQTTPADTGDVSETGEADADPDETGGDAEPDDQVLTAEPQAALEFLVVDGKCPGSRKSMPISCESLAQLAAALPASPTALEAAATCESTATSRSNEDSP